MPEYPLFQGKEYGMLAPHNVQKELFSDSLLTSSCGKQCLSHTGQNCNILYPKKIRSNTTAKKYCQISENFFPMIRIKCDHLNERITKRNPNKKVGFFMHLQAGLELGCNIYENASARYFHHPLQKIC